MTRMTDEDALWTVDPDQFVTARDALARRLREEADRDEAARIKALRKPTRDAWVVNRLAREDPASVRALMAMGDKLRDVLRRGDVVELRKLAPVRPATIETTLAAAELLVGRMTPAVADAVRATLGAALADPEAAQLVKDGRLQTGLVYAGLGVAPSELPDPTPIDRAKRGAQPAQSSGVTSPRSASVSPLERPDAAKLRAAEQDLRDAEDDVTAAQLARAEAQDQVDELAQALSDAKEALAEAQTEARAANRARDAAAAALERLRRRGS